MSDLLDRLDFDLLDRVDLPVEEKVMYSPEMKKAIEDAVREKIKELPIAKFVTVAVDAEVRKQKDILERDLSKKQKSDESFKIDLSGTVTKAQSDFEEKMTKKYDAIMNKINHESEGPRYQFGGFPPPGGGLPIPGTAGLAEWRFIIVGLNLSVQKLENGTWVEKASFLP